MGVDSGRAEEGYDTVTSQLPTYCGIRSKSTESAPDCFRVSAWTQHYSLVGHMLSYLSSLMVVGKIDLRVS